LQTPVNIRAFAVSFSLLITLVLLYSQPVLSTPPSILTQLEEQLQRGQNRALRDVGTLLDRDSLRSAALGLLKRYTLFTEEEFSWSPAPSKTDFLHFYYEHAADLHFSPLLQAFYLTPVEERRVRFFLQMTNPEDWAIPQVNTSNQLRQYIKRFLEEWVVGDPQLLLARLEQIQKLGTRESYYFFLELMRRQSFPKSQAFIYEKLAEKLVYLPNRLSVETILETIEADLLSVEEAAQPLAQLTNVAIEPTDSSYFLSQYNYLLDSLKTLEAMRQYGYQRQFDFRPEFFPHETAYYGTIMSFTDSLPWMQYNAMQDLKNAEHSAVLFYLAGQAYKAYTHGKTAFEPSYYMQELQQLFTTKVGIVDAGGVVNFDPDWENDKVALRNYLYYWAVHYEDYEWDAARQQFIHKDIAMTLTENYEKYFQDLSSTNDSIALHAYRKLTEGDLREVQRVAQRYQAMQRLELNPKVPSITVDYLSQLVKLTDYCHRNDFSYKARPELEQLLAKLAVETTPSERFQLENQVLQIMDISDFTPLEYWGCLQYNQKANAYSLGRILDRAYSAFWKAIIDDEQQLRLYLKKSFLFEKLGTSGICTAYLNKFDMNDSEVQEQLRLLLRLETDQNIIDQIERLLAQSQEPENYEWQDIIRQDIDLERIPPPSKDDYALIFETIRSAQQPHIALRLILYLSLHPSMDMVPELMQLLKTNTIRSEAVALLETIYGYRFQYNGQTVAEQWFDYWKQDSTNYRNWGRTFIEKMVNRVQESPLVDIQEINAITESPFYKNEYRTVCLEALRKVQPVKNIRRLSIEPELSVQTELKYLEGLQFTYKELDDIPALFDIDAPGKLVAFLERQSMNFNIDGRGAFYNNLFRAEWFIQALNSGALSEQQVAYIKQSLTKYLHESMLMSEFEEQATFLNIAQIDHVGEDLEQRLESSFTMDGNVGAKATVQRNIIAGVSYEDIPVVIQHYAQLSPAYNHNFLNEDFGLPIFDLDDETVQQQLLTNHARLTEYEFYFHYLKKFGVDFTHANGSLDFDKIYTILQYDIVLPFVGGGSQRDYYVYGIIKLLELNFKTTLGFHEKLNENQTFYTYSSSERATAWLRFLQTKNLVERSFLQSPSFNMTVNGFGG